LTAEPASPSMCGGWSGDNRGDLRVGPGLVDAQEDPERTTPYEDDAKTLRSAWGIGHPFCEDDILLAPSSLRIRAASCHALGGPHKMDVHTRRTPIVRIGK
jgi:hypothetical protein